jgi:hypothetical protein
MADTLRSLGFILVGGGAQLDLDKAGFDGAVESFSNQVQGADVALFFYAGHGVQVRGSNYLVPVGANPTREADVFLQTVDIAVVLSQMEGIKLNLVILDACRNNPFGSRGLRAMASGLSQMQAPEGTLISFATQPGYVAKDGADDNSPYTWALAHTITRPGLGIFDMFNEVGLRVKEATGGSQQPWLSSSPIAGNFYFAGTPTNVTDMRSSEGSGGTELKAAPPAAPHGSEAMSVTPPAAPPIAAPAAIEADPSDENDWSRAQRADSYAAYQAYAKRHPRGLHVADAIQIALAHALPAEPAIGRLPTGETVLVDDGVCNGNRIKAITGGDVNKGVSRSKKCVPRDHPF